MLLHHTVCRCLRELVQVDDKLLDDLPRSERPNAYLVSRSV